MFLHSLRESDQFGSRLCKQIIKHHYDRCMCASSKQSVHLSDGLPNLSACNKVVVKTWRFNFKEAEVALRDILVKVVGVPPVINLSIWGASWGWVLAEIERIWALICCWNEVFNSKLLTERTPVWTSCWVPIAVAESAVEAVSYWSAILCWERPVQVFVLALNGLVRNPWVDNVCGN